MTEETDRFLFDILQYVRASALTVARGSARSVIDTPRKARVYAALTGDKNLQQIVSSTGIPRATVWRYQVDFLSAGLASPPSKFYRSPRSLYTIEELGLVELASAGAEAGAAEETGEETQ